MNFSETLFEDHHRGEQNIRDQFLLKTMSSRIKEITMVTLCVKRDHNTKKRIRTGKYRLTLRFSYWLPGGTLALAITPQAVEAQVHERSPEWLSCQEGGSGRKANPPRIMDRLDSAFK